MSFSNFYKEQGLDGFANWYQIQAQEERDHAMLFLSSTCRITMFLLPFESIDKPDAVLSEKMDPLKAGYEHEQYVTGLIHTIYEAAYEAKDFRTMQFILVL